MKSQTQKVGLSKLQPNADNPRFIKDEKYKKLKQSLIDFPEMLELRPIVVDESFTILGGNMRFRAAKEIGLKEVFITVAEGLTDEQKKEFIIKDNASFGDWDWDALANDWDDIDLGDWGVDVWKSEEDADEWSKKENYSDFEKLENYLNKETGVLKLSFLQEQYKEVVAKLDDIQDDLMLDNHSETFLKILEAYENLQYKKG